ncbi:Cobalamin biosynthesis protein BluB @ 5,6-dimethylbenzimidazole synthase, flavin destructase family [hydrothermal vent metagenome]|uniref:Cobalamin biosynthesis protein BluB @ 5,6-dimethylbenzimidazole synthase, flavin destructase family n=1 Tax=hydrothermal vent metagenome TaxID=652676 RepID=A0A3B1D4B1_9ZZZZ
MKTAQNKNGHAFEDAEKRGVYRAIHERRDIRKEFLPKKISKKILMKLLNAAHHAGSVGFMQPWNFIVIENTKIKNKVKGIFNKENERAKENYKGKRKEMYSAFKLEGIEESPINICITCDSTRGGKHVIGRNTIKEMDVFSTCGAIQNLWLAARAEGIGVGWVSIIDNKLLKKVLNIPKHIKPVAYLCLGYVSQFDNKPLLEKVGWRKRLLLEDLISWDSWGAKV